METPPTVINLTFMSKDVVGKTAVVKRIVLGKYIDEYEPTIHDVFVKNIDFYHQKYRFNITDTCSCWDYKEYWSIIKKTDCFVLLYAIDNHFSFDMIDKLCYDLKEIKDIDHIQFQCIICGNKCDLNEQREVPKEEARALANKFGAIFLEVSAKTGEGVDQILKDVIAKYYLKDEIKMPHLPKEPSTKEICHIF